MAWRVNSLTIESWSRRSRRRLSVRSRRGSDNTPDGACLWAGLYFGGESGIEGFNALGADTVGKTRFTAGADVGLKAVPMAPLIADVFAVGADGQ